MKVGIGPPHHCLQGPVKIAKRNLTRNQNTPPDRRVCAEEGHFDGKHLHAAFGLIQAALCSAKNLAKEQIDFIFSSPSPRRSSSLIRSSYSSLPKTSINRELRKSYFRSISLRRWVRWCSSSHRSVDFWISLAIRFTS